MTSLYTLTNELQEYLNTTDELDIEKFTSMEGSIENKIESIIHVIRNYQSLADASGEEIKRLQGIKKTYDNKVKSLKEYIAMAMDKTGMQKVETAIGKAYFMNRMKYENIDNALTVVVPEKTKPLGSNDVKKLFELVESEATEEYIVVNDRLVVKETGNVVAVRESMSSLVLK